MPYKDQEHKRKEYKRKWRIENREKISEYNKEYRLKNADRIRNNKRRWTLQNPDHVRDNHKKWRDRNPGYKRKYKTSEQRKLMYKISKESGANQARIKVFYAVKRGDLDDLKNEFVSCSDCDNRATVHDHRDYNKPLKVDPVCHSCNLKRGPAIPLKTRTGNENTQIIRYR